MVLEDLYIYPLKSTRRVTQLYSEVQSWGLVGDRRWMIVDQNAKFLSQREHPRMALIQAVPRPNGRLLLTAQGQEYISMDVPEERAELLPVTVWEDLVPARVASDRVNQWVTEFLGHPVRLVYMHDLQSRLVDPAYTNSKATVSFTDGYPLHCTTKASLHELNKRLTSPIPMSRFRPNLVLSGTQPFDEDTWKRIQIGDVVFAVVKPCPRCVITTVDQDTASGGKEPLRTLSGFRKRDGLVYFGENLVPENTGIIQRGDSVEVLEFDENS